MASFSLSFQLIGKARLSESGSSSAIVCCCCCCCCGGGSVCLFCSWTTSFSHRFFRFSVLMGDAGGVRRVAKRRLGDRVKVDADNSFPAGVMSRIVKRRFGDKVKVDADNPFPVGVMSPRAARRVTFVERSFGIKLREFLIGDLGRRGEGIVIRGDDRMFDRLIGEGGKRCGILRGVLCNDVTFSCSSSVARPRFVLKRFRG